MDPLCHTLVGVALARTGLGKKTSFGTATLIIGANLPDVDVLSYFWGPILPYAFRRGVTHGLPAIFVLPVLLAVLMLVLSRIRPATPRAGAASFRWLLGLATIGVASHPALDWLNNYGMRWLSPFDETWSYGDTLFIIDLVAWTILGVGVFAAARSARRSMAGRHRVAIAALALFLAYTGMNYGLTRVAQRVSLSALGGDPPIRLMAAPVPITPFARAIVLEYADEYRIGSVTFDPRPRFEREPRLIVKGDSGLLERVRRTKDGHRFLSWARFPYVVLREVDGVVRVHVADARYVRDIEAPRPRGFGMISMPLQELPPGDSGYRVTRP